ncbi:MAG: hypothetical protein ACM3XM_11255 [Mycobacterium leprae]
MFQPGRKLPVYRVPMDRVFGVIAVIAFVGLSIPYGVWVGLAGGLFFAFLSLGEWVQKRILMRMGLYAREQTVGEIVSETIVGGMIGRVISSVTIGIALLVGAAVACWILVTQGFPAA